MIRNLKDMGPTLQKIMKRLFANQTLLKLLYYTDKEPLSHPDLTESQIQTEIYNKLIRIIPRVQEMETSNPIIVIRIDGGSQNMQNDEFREIRLTIETFCPLNEWIIKDDNLRPFYILGEIQKSLSGKVIDQVGKLEGGDFKLSFLTNEVSDYSIDFRFELYE